MKKKFKVGTGKPEKSGKYVALTQYDYMTTLYYSTKYQKWNVEDSDTSERVEEVAISEVHVKYWIYEEDFKNALQKCDRQKNLR